MHEPSEVTREDYGLLLQRSDDNKLNHTALSMLQGCDDDDDDSEERVCRDDIGLDVHVDGEGRQQWLSEESGRLDDGVESATTDDHYRDQLPSVVIKNNCGEDLTVALYFNPNRPSAFCTCLATARKIGSVVAPFRSISRLYTPWAMLRTYEGPIFPIVTFTMSMPDGSSYSASPTPLHGLASRPLFLTRHMSNR